MAKYLKLFETHAEYEQYVSGDFEKPNVSHCVQEDDVHYNPMPHDYSKDYLTFVALESGTFTFTPKKNNIISYSTDDGETWTEGNSVSVSNGDKVMWKGTMTPSSTGIGNFGSTAEFDVQGNVMSLLYGDGFKNQTVLTGKNYTFYNLFKNNTKVVNVENLSLPATTLASSCYSNMFNGCTSLTTAPELPAETLATYCYQYMFNGCTSLVTAPALPAETLVDYCYQSMFSGCTSLTTTPELPATTLAEYCYQFMFRGCANLTTAPELPAETLASGCYGNMFGNCTRLTSAPELPATTLESSCYSYMFYGCTSLTTAPELPATTLASGCYGNMFQGCSNLNYIKAMFTTAPSSTYTSNWVSGVASSGIFVKNSAAQWDVSGVHGVPTGWTVQTASE